jgi:hypothetical protein
MTATSSPKRAQRETSCGVSCDSGNEHDDAARLLSRARDPPHEPRSFGPVTVEQNVLARGPDRGLDRFGGRVAGSVKLGGTSRSDSSRKNCSWARRVSSAFTAPLAAGLDDRAPSTILRETGGPSRRTRASADAAALIFAGGSPSATSTHCICLAATPRAASKSDGCTTSLARSRSSGGSAIRRTSPIGAK